MEAWRTAKKDEIMIQCKIRPRRDAVVKRRGKVDNSLNRASRLTRLNASAATEAEKS